MTQQAFGGAHTEEKLNKLEDYLKAYLNVFKNQSWVHTIYFDAFAGTGEIPTAAGRSFACRSTTRARPSLLGRPGGAGPREQLQ